MNSTTIYLSLQGLAKKYGGELSAQNEICFSSLSTDTRTLKKGDVFVALKGPNFDGHTYLDRAKALGACAAIVETVDETIDLPQWCVKKSCEALANCATEKRNIFKGKVIAITGSAGKTTVKGMVSTICLGVAKTCYTAGNFNNHIGAPLTVMRVTNDDEYLVVEAGASEKGDIQHLVNMIKPDVAVALNVLPAHVEGFGSIEKIATEKSKIYTGFNEGGVAVVNADSPFKTFFVEQIGDTASVTFFGVSKASGAQVYAEDIELDAEGKAQFTLCAFGEEMRVQLGVIGEHNVPNALAASAIALEAGVSIDAVVNGLREYNGDKGRMQVTQLQNGMTLIDDSYNANPGSVASAIAYLAQAKNNGRNVYLLLGDMGELGVIAKQQHQHMGELAKTSKLTGLFAVGELCKKTVEAFGSNGEWFETQDLLMQKLAQIRFENAVVLIKGSRSAKMEYVVQALNDMYQNEEAKR